MRIDRLISPNELARSATIRGGLVLLAIATASVVANGQTPYLSPAVPAIAAGNPGSSYAQGAVDSVNLYNGNHCCPAIR
jgi:hypothetical protein